MLKKNMGGMDRFSRAGLGLALIASAAAGALGPWAYLGVIPLVTGLMGMCPLYSALRFNTLKQKK